MDNKIDTQDDYERVFEVIKNLILTEKRNKFLGGLGLGMVIINSINLLAMITVYLTRVLR